MAENIINFSLRIPEELFSMFDELIKGLCAGEYGAAFEERIEPFGEAAEKLAEIILDDWDCSNSPPFFADYERRGTEAVFAMNCGVGVIAEVSRFKDLLEVCGANVDCDLPV